MPETGVKKGYHTRTSHREQKNFVRQHKPGDISKNNCAKGSYRTKAINKCTKLVFCCPQGQYNKGKRKCRGRMKRHVKMIPKTCKKEAGCAKKDMHYVKKERKCAKY